MLEPLAALSTGAGATVVAAGPPTVTVTAPVGREVAVTEIVTVTAV